MLRHMPHDADVKTDIMPTEHHMNTYAWHTSILNLFGIWHAYVHTTPRSSSTSRPPTRAVSAHVRARSRARHKAMHSAHARRVARASTHVASSTHTCMHACDSAQTSTSEHTHTTSSTRTSTPVRSNSARTAWCTAHTAVQLQPGAQHALPQRDSAAPHAGACKHTHACKCMAVHTTDTYLWIHKHSSMCAGAHQYWRA
jgi:hypothetical protein